MKKYFQPDSARDWLLLTIFLGSGFVFTTILIQINACSLCMTQRLAMALGIAVCIGGLIHRETPKTYPLIAIVIWLGGCVVAFRQLWIQYVPGGDGNCGPGIDFLISHDYPLSSIVKTMLVGSGDCAEPSVVPILALCGFVILISTTSIYLKLSSKT